MHQVRRRSLPWVHARRDEDEIAPLLGRERRAAALRQDEAAELTGKLARLVDELNDALDDVRCEVADADDAD